VVTVVGGEYLRPIAPSSRRPPVFSYVAASPPMHRRRAFGAIWHAMFHVNPNPSPLPILRGRGLGGGAAKRRLVQSSEGASHAWRVATNVMSWPLPLTSRRSRAPLGPLSPHAGRGGLSAAVTASWHTVFHVNPKAVVWCGGGRSVRITRVWADLRRGGVPFGRAGPPPIERHSGGGRDPDASPRSDASTPTGSECDWARRVHANRSWSVRRRIFVTDRTCLGPDLRRGDGNLWSTAEPK
jgi:hypothetical protein